MSALFRLDVHHVDRRTAARCGTLHTPHGPVEMPAFMPVGTQGTIKGVTIEHLRATGAQMILGNTYHLTLRPGEDVVAELGGLHAFSDGRDQMTDSGGFQLFSLAEKVKVAEEGATFRSHIDGRLLELSPERTIAIQEALGSDVAMVLDHVVPLPAPSELVADAMHRTLRWALRSRKVARRPDQALFGIVQGGLDPALRVECARGLMDLDFDGYAIGGLSVGETVLDRHAVLEATVPLLPPDRPRYLMGVGTPADLLEAIGRGVDLFDCVMPTRNGRNAMAFTDAGVLRLRNLALARDPRPLEPGCPCPACRHSRGYLRHLFTAHEMLGPILLSIHNLTYYQRLLTEARQAICADDFEGFRARKLESWRTLGGEPPPQAP